jgi:chorismate mutase / prephenate dehydratase
MCAAEKSLADLRREIDAVDDQMHELIMHRAELTLGVKAAKARANNHVYLRPGREALILRRLAAQHEGGFPLGAIVRIWRELLCAQIPIQGPFVIAVATSDDIGLWDSARDHFGSDTAMTAYGDADSALDAVAAGRATLAVLPEPSDDAPWWRNLMERPDGPRIVVKLPFVAMERRDKPAATAYVAGLVPPEASGDDVTILASAAGGDFEAALRAQGLEPLAWRSWPGLAVAEVAGFLAADDDRVRALSENFGPVELLGAYPTPLIASSGATS